MGAFARNPKLRGGIMTAEDPLGLIRRFGVWGADRIRTLLPGTGEGVQVKQRTSVGGPPPHLGERRGS
jgi:hypothetical protein